MNILSRSYLFNKGVGRRRARLMLCGMALGLLAACGGGGGGTTTAGGGPNEEIIGTGFSGKAAIGAAIANADIRVKSQSGVSTSTTTDNTGSFASSALLESSASTPRGPYLLRVEQENGSALYSVAHRENAATIDSDSVAITINIHPFTDLIIRNWFAQRDLDIDAEFTGSSSISAMPTLAEIDAISREFLSILNAVLTANDVADNVDLLDSPFEVNGEGFDGFLDNSQVVINNAIINVIVNQPNVSNSIQNTIITNVDLDTDFTDSDDAAPSLPSTVRVLATDMTGEVLVVWNPSSDDKGVATYNIYRDGTLIGSTPYTVFIDDGLVSGTNYDYTVEAIDSREQSSDITTAVSITLSTPDTVAPPAATDVVLSQENGVVSISWTQASINDVAGFRVLRGPSGNVATEVANITTSAYADFDVMAGTTYCYSILSYDAAGNTSTATSEACITISGAAPEASSVALSSATYSIEESVGSIEIVVNRTGDLSQAISVDYAVTAGTATADTDFVETSGTLMWDATDPAAQTFTIQLNENTEVESDETVNIALSNPSNTVLGNNDSAVLTITDAPQVVCIDLIPTNIITNTTLSEPCYNVNSDLDISNTATLTIEPGVRLVFAENRDITVMADGVLNAVGTEEAPIIFTGAIATAGYWDGIDVRSIAVSQLHHTVVEYAGGNSSIDANVGVLFDGQVSINNSIIRNSANYGVSSEGTDSRIVSFANNTVTLNENAPVFLPGNEVFVLEANNSFTGNITAVGGDRDYIDVANSADGISTMQTWNLLDVDYHMENNSTTVEGQWTLAPGVTLVFPANAILDVRDSGTLIAVGTENQPITFTGLAQTPGFWDGIQVTFSTNDNRLEHVVVEYGGNSGGNTDANVAVFGSNTRLTLSDVVLRHSANFGFEFDQESNFSMSNVTSTDNNQPGSVGLDEIGLLDINSSYTGNADDRIVVISDDIDSDQLIQNIGVPYLLTQESASSIRAALTIAAGVELQFSSGGGFNVSDSGTLIAQGTPTSPVVFTGSQQTKGFWNGIQVTFSTNPNLIDNAVVEYAGQPGGNTEALIGFFGNDTVGTVSNTVLRSSLTNGLWIGIDNTTVDVSTGNTFEDIDGDNIFIDP